MFILSACVSSVLFESYVDASGRPGVVMKRFMLLKHCLAAWDYPEWAQAAMTERIAALIRILAQTLHTKRQQEIAVASTAPSMP